MTMHNRTSELIATGLSVEAAIAAAADERAAAELGRAERPCSYTTNPDGSIKCTFTA